MLHIIRKTNLIKNRTWLPIQPVCGLKQSIEEKLGLPKKPKRPSTTFVKFLTKERSSLIEKYPDASPKEIIQIGSQLWKKSAEATKISLRDEYKRELEEYAKQLAKYNASLTPQQKNEIKEATEELKEQKEIREAKLADSKRKKELGRPTKPLTSYLLYAKSEQKNRGDKSVSEYQSELSKKWQTLSEEAKSVFVKEAAKNQAQYEKTLESWEKKMIKEGNFDVVRQKTLNEDAGKGKKSGQ